MQNALGAFLKEQRREFSDREDREQLWRALWLLPGLRPALKELDIPDPGPEMDEDRRRKHEEWRKELADWADAERVATADEARAAAAAEGLELVPSSRSGTGFKCVYKDGSRYEAKVHEDGKQRFLGKILYMRSWHVCAWLLHM
jgi:hypothetical protein